MCAVFDFVLRVFPFQSVYFNWVDAVTDAKCRNRRPVPDHSQADSRERARGLNKVIKSFEAFRTKVFEI